MSKTCFTKSTITTALNRVNYDPLTNLNVSDFVAESENGSGNLMARNNRRNALKIIVV
jgi:hypothetical protein